MESRHIKVLYTPHSGPIYSPVVYNLSAADLTGVLERAYDIGLEKVVICQATLTIELNTVYVYVCAQIIVTGGNLEQSRQALELAKSDGKQTTSHSLQRKEKTAPSSSNYSF